MLKKQCTEHFFQAIGSKWLSKPGRKALQMKLMKNFIETRNNFVNNDNIGILQQKNVLLEQEQKKSINHHKGVSIEDHFLHIVKEKEIPVVTIHGEDDSVISVDHAERIHSYLTSHDKDNANKVNSQLFILKECDHLCWITHGHEVVDILGDFWSKTVVSD